MVSWPTLGFNFNFPTSVYVTFLFELPQAYVLQDWAIRPNINLQFTLRSEKTDFLFYIFSKIKELLAKLLQKNWEFAQFFLAVALKKTVVTTAQLLQFVAHSSITFDPVYLSKKEKKEKESNRPPVKTNLKQGAHIHHPTAWLVPHACAKPYHSGSDSHGQQFCPHWGSSAWHSRRVHERGKSPCIKVLL